MSNETSPKTRWQIFDFYKKIRGSNENGKLDNYDLSEIIAETPPIKEVPVLFHIEQKELETPDGQAKLAKIDDLAKKDGRIVERIGTTPLIIGGITATAVVFGVGTYFALKYLKDRKANIADK